MKSYHVAFGVAVVLIGLGGVMGVIGVKKLQKPEATPTEIHHQEVVEAAKQTIEEAHNWRKKQPSQLTESEWVDACFEFKSPHIYRCTNSGFVEFDVWWDGKKLAELDSVEQAQGLITNLVTRLAHECFLDPHTAPEPKPETPCGEKVQ